MNNFMRAAADSYHNDFYMKIEVYNIVREMVEDVEIWDAENALRKAQKNLQYSEKLNELMAGKVKRLQTRNARLDEDMAKLKLNATITRDSFIGDIGQFLIETKHTKKLKDKIAELEAKLNNIYEDNPDYMTNNASNQKVETSTEVVTSPTAQDETAVTPSTAEQGEVSAVTAVKEQELFLYDLEDEFLLQVFSFLETAEVLHVSQACKYVLKRVYFLFAIETSMLKDDWSVRPDRKALLLAQAQAQTQAQTLKVSTTESDKNSAVSTATSAASIATANAAATAAGALSASATNNNSNSSGGVSSANSPPVPADPMLTKEIVDVLIKKLTAAELKVILSMAERSKKQAAQIEAMGAEREDLSERLQNTESVRNYFIEKLKTAEVEIKSLMGKNSALKKQSASDQEIIAYLDLKGNELESQKMELGTRCHHLQASLDLQIGSHSHKEHQLSSELHDYKLKFEKLDINSKAQKKVLIKEVKTLRAQVESLTNERNLQANQFRLLREALSGSSLLSPNSNSSSSSNPNNNK